MKIVSLVLAAAGLVLALPSTALATYSGIAGKIAWTELRDPNTPTQHRVIIVDGAVRSTPTVRSGNSDNDGSPAWSPDGKRLAWVRANGLDSGSSQIWVQDEGGTNVRMAFDASTLSSSSPYRYGTFTSLVWLSNETVGFVGGTGTGLINVDVPPCSVCIGGFITGGIYPGSTLDVSQYGLVSRCGTAFPGSLCIGSGQPQYLTIPAPAGAQLVSWSVPSWWPKRNTRRLAAALGVIRNGVAYQEIAEIQFDPLGLAPGNARKVKSLTTSGVVSCQSNRSAQFIYGDPVPSPDGKFVLVQLQENTFIVDQFGRCLTQTINRGIQRLNENGSLAGLVSESNDPRDAAWQAIAPTLTVDVTDGHGHPLDNLLVELFDFEDPTIRIDATAKNLEGGHYAFEDVAPGDYRVRATLKESQWFSFQIVHAFTVSLPGEAVWVEKKLDFDSVNQVFSFPFTEDDITGTSLVDTPEAVDRLDDLAAIYYQTLRYVKFARTTLQQETGALLTIVPFAELVLGRPFASNDAVYFKGLPAFYLGTDISEFQARESPGDECPTNCEWHEFGHHLVSQFVMPGVVCPGTNHGGYANPDTCDSMDEGIAAFLASQLEQSPDYGGGLIDLESHIKARGLRWSSSGQLKSSEDSAVSALLWDLVDSKSDSESATTIAANRLHMQVSYRDDASMPLLQVWTLLTQNRVETVRELHTVLATVPPVSFLTNDLDLDGVPDASIADSIFLLHGFFRATQDFPISTTHAQIHYDAALARLEGRAYNDDVGKTDHFSFNLGNGITGEPIVPRHHMESGSGATVGVTLEDASGTQLHGGSLDLAIGYPEGTRSLQRSLGARVTSTARAAGVSPRLSRRRRRAALQPRDGLRRECDCTRDAERIHLAARAELRQLHVL